jgi:hypothetical protein
VRHNYKAQLSWEGNLGQGTRTYAGYGRQYSVRIAGKPDLNGSADTDAGVNIEVPYSDHDHNLVLIVDDEAIAKAVCESWEHNR